MCTAGWWKLLFHHGLFRECQHPSVRARRAILFCIRFSLFIYIFKLLCTVDDLLCRSFSAKWRGIYSKWHFIDLNAEIFRQLLLKSLKVILLHYFYQVFFFFVVVCLVLGWVKPRNNSGRSKCTVQFNCPLFVASLCTDQSRFDESNIWLVIEDRVELIFLQRPFSLTRTFRLQKSEFLIFVSWLKYNWPIQICKST